MMTQNPCSSIFSKVRNNCKVLAFVWLLLCALPTQAQVNPEKNIAGNTLLHFQENKGQVSDQNRQPRPDVLFSGTDGQLVYHLKNNGISYQLNRVDSWKEKDNLEGLPATEQTKIPDQTTIYRLDVNWLNANTTATVTKGEALSGVSNFYNAVCPNGVIGVQSFNTITYQQIYSGIDLKWYSKENRLKYDYIVAAGANYQQIQLQFEGAESLSIGKGGELMIKTPLGELVEQAPLVLQDGKTLLSKWVIKNNIVSFQIENIDANQAFTIDPFVRVWGTYLGTTSFEYAHSCITDALMDVYMAGETASTTTIATSGSHQSVYGGGTSDAYLAKFNALGVMLWSTYYGGSADDYGYSAAIDPSGKIYLAGYTASTTAIATVGAHQDVYGGGGYDAFLVQFNTSGVRQWGTYYGGTGFDQGQACATDGSGNVYLTGYAASTTGMATAGSFQATSGGGYDAFLVQFLSSGTRVWGTYLGAASNEFPHAICIDPLGSIYICGETSSTALFATVGAHQTVYGGSSNDAFLAKFDVAGARLWSTYYGGTGLDNANACTTDALGNVYMVGYTASLNAMASAGSFQSVYAGGSNDAYLVQFNTSGVRQWATYYGGTSVDYGLGCKVDALGNFYLMGHTGSTSAIATVGSYQPTYGGGSRDAFIAQFSLTGVRQWGTYLGGTGDDRAYCGATDLSGNIYITGWTSSPNAISTPSAWQTTLGGGTADSFLAKFKDCSISVSPTSQTNNLCFGGSSGTAEVTVTGGSGGNTFDWLPGNPTGDGTAAVSGLTAGTYTVTVTDNSTCNASQTFTITQPPALITTITANGILCNGGTTAVTVVGVGGTAPYTGEGTFNVSAGLQSFTLTDANGCSATTSFTFTEPPAVVVATSATSILCHGDTATVTVTGSGGVGGYSGEGTYASTAGTYSYTITDANGCTGTGSIVITEPTMVIASPNAVPILCHGGTTTLTIAGSGGTSPYSGEGSSVVTAGTYTFTITDANGCFDTQSITITEPTALLASATSTAILCNGGTADITISGSGGTPGYINTGTFTVNAGTYTYHISDENGCPDSVNITVTEPAVLVATLVAATNPTTCGGTDGTIDISINGGTPGYSYLWNTSANTEDLSTLGAGVYSCAIADTNGCTSSTSVTLVDPNPPTVVLAVGVDTVCNLDGAFVLTGGTPVGGTYSGPGVSGGSFNPTTANAGANTITYTYTDAQTGCSASNTDIIFVDPCAGILENSFANTFNVYPNPNNGTFILTLNTNSVATVLLYDALGQLVRGENTQPNISQPFNIEQAGVYLIAVVTTDGKRSLQRVVVNK